MRTPCRASGGAPQAKTTTATRSPPPLPPLNAGPARKILPSQNVTACALHHRLARLPARRRVAATRSPLAPSKLPYTCRPSPPSPPPPLGARTPPRRPRMLTRLPPHTLPPPLRAQALSRHRRRRRAPHTRHRASPHTPYTRRTRPPPSPPSLETRRRPHVPDRRIQAPPPAHPPPLHAHTRPRRRSSR